MVRNSKGFTLIELMVVILIVGILAALAIPKFTNASARAKFAEVPTAIAAWDNAQLARIAETGAVAHDAANLIFDAPTGSKWFTYGAGPGNAADNATYAATAISAVGSFTAASTVGSKALTLGSAISHHSSLHAVVEQLAPNFDAGAW